MLRLAGTGFSGGNQTRPLSALGMDDNQQSSKGIHAESDLPLFAVCVRVFYREREGIAQNLFRMGEANFVLSEICDGLVRIELNFHTGECMHMKYA